MGDSGQGGSRMKLVSALAAACLAIAGFIMPGDEAKAGGIEVRIYERHTSYRHYERVTVLSRTRATACMATGITGRVMSITTGSGSRPARCGPASSSTCPSRDARSFTMAASTRVTIAGAPTVTAPITGAATASSRITAPAGSATRLTTEGGAGTNSLLSR